MINLIRCMQSDFHKFRHSALLLIHILLPSAASLLFLAYYSVSPWKTEDKISGYFEFISTAFPFIIGLICSMAIEQERQAGNFQVILCVIKSRTITYLSKLLVLLLLGTCSVALAIGIFGTVFQNAAPFFYLKAAGAIFVSSVFLYILHLFLSFQYGKGASIGLGIVESLTSALMLTGLGDGKWYFIPCAWGARIGDCLVYGWQNPVNSATVNATIVKGIIIAVTTAVVALLISLIWFSNWEGRASYD